jgi:cell division protein FtsW (lipid II flippase)
MKKKYLLLVFSFVPFALFHVSEYFRTDRAMLCLSIASLFFLVTYIFSRKINYSDKEKRFSLNWPIFLVAVASALLNFFVLFLSAFALQHYHWVVIIVALVLFLASLIKSFNNLIKTF